ncbi:hypothetical protein Pmani_005763 [Petrolisthes manimaculis]|uniref:Transient receptor ion channel domain-containing protein n=1 Tax=Petrolisthes manimaculis TaxID=1843537 RepID=A0AAE1QB14_9EUCA|nr:hypothetical protein Pmani_005763 [Petrolisthes manimaculis]
MAEMPNLPKPLTLEEKKFLLGVERGDITTTRKMLQKAHRHHDYMNMNCVDPLGRSALHMAISNENLEMVELLVVMGVETRDSLLHAIDAEFVEAVEVLLEHEEVVHKEGDIYSWEKADRNISAFTHEITPLILAAHKDNYEILKILLDRGAMIPMPHDIRCGCPECIKTSKEDSLRHSRSRINSYRALSSPSLIALTSTDPILTAFQLSLELKNLAYTENEFRAEYLELRSKTMKFAEELLGHARSSSELAVMLNHDPDTFCPYRDGQHMTLKRLELAIDCKQKRFVAHPNIQQLLAALWYAGIPGFRRKAVVDKCLEIVKVVALFPFYCMWYMLMPDSDTGKLMRTPFMKFLTHSASYLFFLMMLILVSVRFENLVIWLFGTEAMQRGLIESMRRQRGNLPTPIECVVMLWVLGFLWEEVKQIRRESLRKYLGNMWNLLDIMRDSLYSMTMVLRLIAFIQQSQEISRAPSTAFIPREEWDTFDPQLVSEGLFAAANILSALKLVHIFSINPYLGPLQISLGRMVIDIVKFFFIYTLVLFAFACGLTQLLWYYNDLEKAKCYSLPGGLPDWTKQSDACMKWRRFHNLFEASQSLFWAGFGMVGLGDFELTGIREYTRFWSMLMFGSYSVINIIVLLNLLIAMMSSSYSFIVEHADTEWKFARTKLWMSYFEEGNTLPPPFNMFPNVKFMQRLFGKTSQKEQMVRQMSTRTQDRKRRARDYGYLSVMRALIWRYVCSLQRRNEERPVNEDDISEVKGDISSLRFELIDLFGQNGMDVSMCAKKSRAALGRKMRVWERRLMRDFHVSPAMGSEDVIARGSIHEPAEETAAEKFRRVARLAMKVQAINTDNSELSQIGFGCDQGRESLKVAMEKARRKMEEGTPDGSPGSSRGCSPYPDLYTGPHLLDAIKNLDLSPNASPAESPMPPMDGKPWMPPGKAKDGQAKDPNMLTVPGRRSSTTLKQHEAEKLGRNMSLDVPVNAFSKDSIKKLTKTPDAAPAAGAPKKVASPPQNKAPAAKPTPVLKPEVKAPAVLRTESETGGEKKVVKEEGKVQKKEISNSSSGFMKIAADDKRKEASISSRPIIPAKESEGVLRPSQIKNSGVLPVVGQQQSRPAPSMVRDGPRPFKPSVPEPHMSRQERPRQPPSQNTFTGSDELENIDFVRRPTRPLVNTSPPPAIAVIPSTPKHPETPLSTPLVDNLSGPIAGKKSNPMKKIDETKSTEGKAADMKPKPAEVKEEKQKPKLPEAKPAEPKPVEIKTTEPKEAETKPAKTKPVDTKPAETKPVETKADVKPAESAPKATEKTEKPSEPKSKTVAPQPPASTIPEQKKAPTPPAATFHGNSSTSPSDLLLAPAESKKKGGWL